MDEPAGGSGPEQTVQFYKYSSVWGTNLLVKAFPVGRRIAMRGRLTPARNGEGQSFFRDIPRSFCSTKAAP